MDRHTVVTPSLSPFFPPFHRNVPGPLSLGLEHGYSRHRIIATTPLPAVSQLLTISARHRLVDFHLLSPAPGPQIFFRHLWLGAFGFDGFGRRGRRPVPRLALGHRLGAGGDNRGTEGLSARTPPEVALGGPRYGPTVGSGHTSDLGYRRPVAPGGNPWRTKAWTDCREWSCLRLGIPKAGEGQPGNPRRTCLVLLRIWPQG